MSKGTDHSGDDTGEARDRTILEDGLIVALTDLLLGDILLFRSKTATAMAIRAATGSPYTHAAIYVGDGQIAESNWPRVQVRELTEADLQKSQIGVLRSQMGFLEDRAATVRDFVEQLVKEGAGYDWQGVTTFEGRQANFYATVMKELAANYGKVTPKDELLKQRYFCSALVVACYIVAGVIGDTAHVVYPPDVFSPGDLHRDATFGWVLGYLVPPGSSVPENDPLLFEMHWKDSNPEQRWWEL
ncbi:MAG: hypothetical protein AB7V46_22355 [Thermomicrobiales bacterium]